MKTITEFPGIKLKDGVMLLKSIIDGKKAARTKAELEAKLLAKGAKEKDQSENTNGEKTEAPEAAAAAIESQETRSDGGEAQSETEKSETPKVETSAESTESPVDGETEQETDSNESGSEVTASAETAPENTENTEETKAEETELDAASLTQGDEPTPAAEAAAESVETASAAEESENKSDSNSKGGKQNRSEELKAARQKEREETTDELRGMLEKSYSLEGEKLEFLVNAVLTVDRRRVTDIRRVVVLQLEEGEKEPKGVQKRGEHFYRAEYLPPLKKDKKRFSKGKGRGNQKRKKRRFDKKRRPRRPNDRTDGKSAGGRGKTTAAPVSGS